MSAQFHVKTVLHPEGERLPILLDANRHPVVWINLYIIRHLRARLSSNSLVKITRILGFLWDWASRQELSQRDSHATGNGLTQVEIEGNLYPWMRRNFRAKDTVRRLTVVPSSVEFRLDVVWDFIEWHLNGAICARPVGSREIKDIKAKLEACRKSFESAACARRQSPLHAWALSEVELKRLLDICEPGSPDNCWQRACRERNRLVIRLMAMLGLRRGELLKLRVSDCHLTRTIPEIRIERSPDDRLDPRINEPQVKTESRQLPCDVQLAQELNEYICKIRRVIPGSDRTPYLFLSRSGRPMSLNRVNGIVEQVGNVNPEFSALSPHCLRSTCATRFKELGLKRGLAESEVDKDMKYFFGWRSDKSIDPYVEGSTRREAAEIGLAYQHALFERSSRLSPCDHDE